jgi:hypothetical protein
LPTQALGFLPQPNDDAAGEECNDTEHGSQRDGNISKSRRRADLGTDHACLCRNCDGPVGAAALEVVGATAIGAVAAARHLSGRIRGIAILYPKSQDSGPMHSLPNRSNVVT